MWPSSGNVGADASADLDAAGDQHRQPAGSCGQHSLWHAARSHWWLGAVHLVTGYSRFASDGTLVEHPPGHFGTPFGGTDGTFNFVVQVRDAQGTTLQKSMAIPTQRRLRLHRRKQPNCYYDFTFVGPGGVSYITVATATGGTPPYNWSAVGLPAGLSMTTTGVISGTPTASCVPGVPAVPCPPVRSP